MEALAQLTTPAYTSLSLGNFLRPQVSGGKIALPIRPYTVYAQFKHIEAVPARGGAGYSISKVRTLDTLIDRLVQLKERNLSQPSSQELGSLSDEALDALIQEYSQKLNMALQTGMAKLEADYGIAFAGAPIPTSAGHGSLVNLVA